MMGCNAFSSFHGGAAHKGCRTCFSGYVHPDTPCPRAKQISEAEKHEFDYMLHLAGPRREFSVVPAGGSYQGSSYRLVFSGADKDVTASRLFDGRDLSRMVHRLIAAGFSEKRAE